MIFGWFVDKPEFYLPPDGLFWAENMAAAQDKLRSALGFSADNLIFKIAPGVVVDPDFMQFGHLFTAGAEQIIGFLYVATVGDAAYETSDDMYSQSSQSHGYDVVEYTGLLKYGFFAADKKFHKPELEQFEAMDDIHARETIGAAIGDIDGQAFFNEPIVSNPAALYGRSWFVYVPAQHENKAVAGRVFAGYLYTTGR